MSTYLRSATLPLDAEKISQKYNMNKIHPEAKKEESNDEFEDQRAANPEEEADEDGDQQINLTGSQSAYVENMKNFVNYYGVQIQVPGHYVFASQSYPLSPTLCIQSVALVYTANSDMRLRTCYLDGT